MKPKPVKWWGLYGRDGKLFMTNEDKVLLQRYKELDGDRICPIFITPIERKKRRWNSCGTFTSSKIERKKK
jgi:hypothetical protein